MGEANVISVIVSAVIQCAIGLLFWFAVRRNVEMLDQLKDRVRTLEEKRITGLENAFEEHVRANADAREKLFNELRHIDSTFITREQCKELHRASLGQFEKFQSAVLDLAKIEEKTRATAAFVEEVNERVIAAMQDIARMEGAR